MALSGPLKDSVFALPGGEVPIGRDPSNLLAITDPSLSRRHCVLVPDQGHYLVRDDHSRNGTYINGVSVTEAKLQHGDQISIGDSVFVLLLHEEGREFPAAGVQFEDDSTQPTAEFRPQDVLYLQPDRILRELPPTSRLARNLNALLKISRAIHQVRDLDQLQDRILDSVFEVAPAERGAILLDGQGEKFASVHARHRNAAEALPIRVSRTIARKVLEEKLAVLGTDVRGAGNLSGVESLVASNVRSLIGVPLMVFEKVTGCIYLDTTNPAVRFDEDHLQLVATIAAISSSALENARHLQWLEQENLRLATEINLEHNLVGETAPMKQVYEFISRVATADSTVLIEGESGTGKELVARAIHRNSPRQHRPFITINCAAIPEGLLESELFGHERGSFTGAVTQKKGKFELADGGTIFLDEIGEMPPALQVKLLRVLQEREFERLGGTRTVSINVRIIAATNKNLAAAVQARQFRSDLYYRLNVVCLVMPPLRERRDDIPLLAYHFLQKLGGRNGGKKKVLPEAMSCLVNYEWPGNVRELENTIERALVLSSADSIRVEDLPESILESGGLANLDSARYHVAVKELKKQLILNAVEEAQGNYTEAARILGVHANYLHRLVRNLNLRGRISAGSRQASVVRKGKSSGPGTQDPTHDN
ncbi:MAG TPA: sigma 54-interacting transcriptional regulator [Terriglobales bacterium]